MFILITVRIGTPICSIQRNLKIKILLFIYFNIIHFNIQVDAEILIQTIILGV